MNFFKPKIFLIIACLFAISLNFISPSRTYAFASLNLVSSGGDYKIGSTFSITLYVNSGGQSINAVEGVINYPSNLVEFKSVSTSGTIFDFWTRGPISNATYTSFGGGMADPGFNGSSGKILTMTFKVKQAGYINYIISGARVLANDGEGTNIMASSNGGALRIGNPPPKKTPPPPPSPSTPKLKSSTHPDQNRWYKERKAIFTWTPGIGNTGYYYSFNQIPQSGPPTDTLYNQTSKTIDNVADGIWYFHLRAKTDKELLPAIHYKIQIDNTLPNPFEVKVNQNSDPANPFPKVTFAATDNQSGISRYEVFLDTTLLPSFKSGDTLPKQHPGKHKILIKAYDNTGNIRESTVEFTVIGIDAPKVIIMNKVISLMDTVCFQGNSGETDTIYLNMDKKNLTNFLAKDHKLKKARAEELPAPESNQISWEYCYSNLIIPGAHTFTFSRTNINGAESEQSKPLKLTVEAATVKIGDFIFPMGFVLTILLIILGLLILFILILGRIIWKLIKRSREKTIPISAWIKNSKYFSKKIKTDIDSLIPERNLSKSEIKEIKEKLELEIAETQKDLNKNIQD